MAEVVADVPQSTAVDENSSNSDKIESADATTVPETLPNEKETNGASKRMREEGEENKDEITKKPKVDDESTKEAEAEMKETEEEGKKPESAKLGPMEFESREVMFNYFFKFIHYWPPNLDVNKIYLDYGDLVTVLCSSIRKKKMFFAYHFSRFPAAHDHRKGHAAASLQSTPSATGSRPRSPLICAPDAPGAPQPAARACQNKQSRSNLARRQAPAADAASTSWWAPPQSSSCCRRINQNPYLILEKLGRSLI